MSMTSRVIQSSFLAVFVFAGTACQSPLDYVAWTHIEGNVPKGELFDQYLKRDLDQYFCKEQNECSVQYELLRKGPTQTGIAFPKFYVWVRVVAAQTTLTEGAAQVAAIDQKRFEVTDFLSRAEIKESPHKLDSIFPAALVERIVRKASP